MAHLKKFLNLCEAYHTRLERGGFLVGDVFKFNDDFKNTEEYKSLGVNTRDTIDQMIESGLHIRVTGIKDDGSPRYPGNPQTASLNVSLTLAMDNGGGRYSHFINVPHTLGTAISYAPGLPPIPDAFKRKSDVNIKPQKYEQGDNPSNMSDLGDGKLSKSNVSNATTNTTIPSSSSRASGKVSNYTYDYIKGLK
jgi:hypothetical protein